MPRNVQQDQCSMLLQFRKRSGDQWKRRTIKLRKTSQASDRRGSVEVYRPRSSSITKKLGNLRVDSLSKIEVFRGSHVIIKDKEERSLAICSFRKTKQTCYVFAAFNEKEVDDLKTLQHFFEDLCEIKSFDVSVDSESNSCVPSGSALLHVYEEKACLTSRTQPIYVLHEWSLTQPQVQFQWERHGFHIIDSNQPTQHCFLYTSSLVDIQNIKTAIHSKRERNKETDCHDTNLLISSQSQKAPSIQQMNSNNSLPVTEQTDPIRRKSASSLPVKEDVQIRFPYARRCYSDTTLKTSPNLGHSNRFKSSSFDRKNDKNRSHERELHILPQDRVKNEQKNINDVLPGNSQIRTDCNKDDETLHKMPDLRPKVYMYMNVNRCTQQEVPNTYVNIFSGSTFQGCYENWQQQRTIYSTIQEMLPPPIPPRPHPPKVPPRRHQLGYYDGGLQKPPPLPPKSKSPKPCVKVPEASNTGSTPRIQVALFGGTPVSGRVWFLRVAFMHQDENDTTLKRVKDIEAYSNHRLLKTISLEVVSDVTMNVTVNSEQGFCLLNGHHQHIELLDIQELRKGDWFIVEFHIQNSDESQYHLTGNVTIEPNTTATCRRSCRASMGIDEIFQRKVMDVNSVDMHQKESLLSDYNKRQNLCRALDMTIHSQGHDWRQVAGSLGFTHAEILELQDKSKRSVQFSPTDEVLTIWQQRDPNCKLDKLVNILREIGRLDIVQDLGYSITLES